MWQLLVVMFHRNAYQLFLKTFMTDASHIDPEYREKEAPRYWQMLPDADKAKHRKRLNDMKQKYIKDYEKFLKVRCGPTLSIRLLCDCHCHSRCLSIRGLLWILYERNLPFKWGHFDYLHLHFPPSCVILGSHYGLNEICALLVFYSTQNGSFLRTFWVYTSIPSSWVKQSNKTLEDETDRLLWNVSKKLPFCTA